VLAALSLPEDPYELLAHHAQVLETLSRLRRRYRRQQLGQVDDEVEQLGGNGRGHVTVGHQRRACRPTPSRASIMLRRASLTGRAPIEAVNSSRSSSLVA
jgi:hypothetical protein